MMKKDTDYPVIVYGSLKSMYGNHRLLQNAEALGEALTEQEYTMLDLGGIPGVIKTPSKRVLGEVYRVNEKELQDLDWLESNGSLYEREVVPTTLGPCWMYIFLREDWGSEEFKTEENHYVW